MGTHGTYGEGGREGDQAFPEGGGGGGGGGGKEEEEEDDGEEEKANSPHQAYPNPCHLHSPVGIANVGTGHRQANSLLETGRRLQHDVDSRYADLQSRDDDQQEHEGDENEVRVNAM
eukprot:561558-Rhodomonas_salina.2